MLFIFILFFLFIKFNSSIINNSLILSLDSNNISISYSFLELLKFIKQKITDKTGKPIISYISTQIISADLNKSIILDLPFENGDIGTDIMELLYIQKEGKLFPIYQFNINYYINNSELINSINYKKSIISNNLDINCNYSIGKNKINLKTLNYDLNNFYKILHYSYLTFGLDNETKKIMYIKYSDDNLNFLDIKNNEIETNYIDALIIQDFFIINQFYINETYLVLYSKNKILFFYLIELDNLSYKLKYFIHINCSNIFNDKEIIYKIGIINNYFIISTNNKRFFKLFKQKNNNNDWIISNIYNSSNVLDFIINKKTIYCIVENIGLFIYKTFDNYSYCKILSHKYMNKIFFYYNPFYGNNFIGIQFNNNNTNINEIYFELIINNELYPIVNKIIVANNNRTFLPIYSMDFFILNLFDIKSNELFLIRKGMLSSIPFITFKFYLDLNLKINSITSLFDYNNKNFSLVFITKDKNIIILKSIIFGKHYLNCTFYDDGIFKLNFIQRGEVCSNSLEASNEYSYTTCNKIIKYNFHIYKKDLSIVYFAFIVCLFIFLLFSIVVFFLIIYNTNCFRVNNLKLVKVKKTKNELYKEEEEKELLKNEKNKQKLNNDNNNKYIFKKNTKQKDINIKKEFTTNSMPLNIENENSENIIKIIRKKNKIK